MLKSVAMMIRRAVINQEEEDVLRIGKVVHFTSKHLLFVRPGGEERVPILGFAVNQCYTIGNMALTVDGKSFGWIENIKIEVSTSRAVVGHFAVAKHLTGIGLASRLAFAFGRFVKAEHGVTHVLFDEIKINSNPAYRKFFQNKLQASAVDPQHNQWLWTIP